MSPEELVAMRALFGGARMVGRKVSVTVDMFTGGEVLISPAHARALLVTPFPWDAR